MTKPAKSSKPTPEARTPLSFDPPSVEEGTLEEAQAGAKVQSRAEAKHESDESLKRAGYNPAVVKALLAVLFVLFVFIATLPFMIIFLLNAPPPAVYTIRKVLTPEVRPGELLRIRIAADVSQQCDALVYRAIVDASGRRHGFDPAPRPDEPEYIIELVTPLEAVPGPAYYSGRVDWSCNLLQQWWPQSVLQKSIPFTILPSDKSLPDIQQQLAPTGSIRPPEPSSDQNSGSFDSGMPTITTDQWIPNQAYVKNHE